MVSGRFRLARWVAEVDRGLSVVSPLLLEGPGGVSTSKATLVEYPFGCSYWGVLSPSLSSTLETSILCTICRDSDMSYGRTVIWRLSVLVVLAAYGEMDRNAALRMAWQKGSVVLKAS